MFMSMVFSQHDYGNAVSPGELVDEGRVRKNGENGETASDSVIAAGKLDVK
jgi:hypothetical protein